MRENPGKPENRATMDPMLGLPTILAVAALGQGAYNPNVAALEFQNADVREAIRQLFKMVGASFVIAPDVQGNVTVRLKNVPFDTALEQLVRQVDATYRMEGPIYSVVLRSPAPARFVAEQGQIDREYARLATLVDPTRAADLSKWLGKAFVWHTSTGRPVVGEGARRALAEDERRRRLRTARVRDVDPPAEKAERYASVEVDYAASPLDVRARYVDTWLRSAGTWRLVARRPR